MESMIHDMAERLFRDHVTHRMREDAASGQRPEALWTQIEEAGLTMALVPEDAGGFGVPPAEALGLVRIVGAHGLPLPLAETLIANAVLAAANMALPGGRLTIAEGEATDGTAVASIAEGEADADDHAATDAVEPAAHVTEAEHGEEGEGAAEEHHYAFGGEPGDGALYFGPENHILDDAHASPKLVKASPFFAMLFGLVLAWWMYIRNPSLPGRLAANQSHLYQFLLNKWYFDEIYNAIFVRPAHGLARFLWKRGDGTVIDGGINGLAMGIIPFFTRLAGRAQSGYLFHYAFAMVLGIAVLITWMAISGGAE